MRSFDFYRAVWWLFASSDGLSLQDSARDILKNLPTVELVELSEAFIRETEEERRESFQKILGSLSIEQLEKAKAKLKVSDVPPPFSN